MKKMIEESKKAKIHLSTKWGSIVEVKCESKEQADQCKKVFSQALTEDELNRVQFLYPVNSPE